MLMHRGFLSIAKMWRDKYLSISKRSNTTSAILPTSSTRELMTNLASISIRDIGDETLIRMIGAWNEQGLLTKKQASDHRKAIRESVKKDMKKTGNEFIEKLDKKIKQSVRFFI
jgi:quinol monooxygenase YgiN